MNKVDDSVIITIKTTITFLENYELGRNNPLAQYIAVGVSKFHFVP